MTVIRFPQELRTAAVEDYRDELAQILILPAAFWSMLPILKAQAEQEVRASLDRLRNANVAFSDHK